MDTLKLLSHSFSVNIQHWMYCVHTLNIILKWLLWNPQLRILKLINTLTTVRRMRPNCITVLITVRRMRPYHVDVLQMDFPPLLCIATLCLYDIVG